MGKKIDDLDIRELPPDLMEHAIKNLNEDPKRRAADVQAIRDWLKKQPHIKGSLDDQTIVNFLRGCKFSLERTKEKLDMYFTVKTALPEFFHGRDFKSKTMQEILDLAFFFPLPEPDEQGRRVFLLRGGMNDPNKIKMEDVFKANFMMMDMIIRKDDRAIVKGSVYVMDMGSLSMGHVSQMTPSFVKKVSVCSEEGFPVRPQSQNFINTPSFFTMIYNIFNTFAKEKIRQRNAVHGHNMESLYKNVPQRLLPSEYGGTAGPIEKINSDFVRELLEFNDWYLEDAKSGVDEKKRPGKPKTSQDLFGLEGSFRQLTVLRRKRVRLVHFLSFIRVLKAMADDVGNLKIRPLPPDLLEYAKKKLHEDPKRRASDVQAIREWLKKQAHINADPDDQLIISFLRGCKFSLEKTKEKFDMYYTMKTMVPEFFKNRDLTKDAALKEVLELGYFYPCGIDDEGRRVYLFIGGKDDPSKNCVVHMLKMNFMVMDYFMMNDDVSVVKGVVIVNDMSAMKMGHATQFLPSIIKKVSVCSEEGLPFRPQAMHMIKMPTFMETLFKLFQSFNKEKMNKRIHVHGKDLESLFKKVPKRVMPKEFGGDGPSDVELAEDFISKIYAFNDWYVADEKSGVDEKKRVGKSRTKEDLFGMEGSFRQLTLD
ncbi:uncharacterized protein LOC132205226 [Neocloeon triangulifer]|uniref:uncharacterized protein LOC132205226 n=1 Tax=Neocloeon triangulifer TaxID=2078957 RepID=UPI00286F4850|nr:uncharacterized protein LOC132205226 [Neocloeon triangulifer]